MHSTHVTTPPLKHEQLENIVSVERNAEMYVVKPNKNGDWKVFQGPSVKAISRSSPTYLHGGDSLTIYHRLFRRPHIFCHRKAERKRYVIRLGKAYTYGGNA
ncbi:MAG: hypothetical protein LBG19_03395 [Prevotellaceae bacterium]|nr:hypothetical protein [Prevotellaceae bacterium]